MPWGFVVQNVMFGKVIHLNKKTCRDKIEVLSYVTHHGFSPQNFSKILF